MTVENLISKVRVMLSHKKVAKQAFAEAVLIDGTMVQTEGELEVGAVLSVVAEDGTLTPAPSAIHETTEGLLVTVGEAGVIENIDTVIEEDLAKDKKEEKMEEVEVEVADEINAEATAELLQGIADLITPFTQEIETIKEELSKLSARFEKIADEPARKPITRAFAEEAKAASTIAEARIAKLVQLRNK